MVKKILFFFAFLILIGALWFGYQYFQGSKPQGGGAPAGRGGTLGVEVFEVQPRALAETLRATGTLRASEFISVRSEESGKVANQSMGKA